MARIHLDDLIRAEKKIYVRNMTNPRGQIILTVADMQSGKINRVPIPKLTLPIPLSDRLPARLVESSTDLRNYISKGILQLIDPEEAEAVLDEKTATGESNWDVVREAIAVAENATSKSALEMRSKVSREEFEVKAEDEDGSSNAKVALVLSQVAEGDMKVRDALKELQPIADQLSESDLNHIIAQVPEGLLKKWAKTELARRRAAESEMEE